jgi:type IV fimbrial biogenesis protein FimT
MRQTGVTLVEWVVVLGICAILFAIAAPGYAYFVRINRLAAATNELVTTLQLARSEAVKRATRVTVCKSSNPMDVQPSCNAAAAWEEGRVVFVDNGTRGLIDGTDQILHVRGPADISYTTSNYSAYISYLSPGTSQGSNGLANGSFSLCHEGELRKVILNTTGRIRLEKGTC